MKAADAFPFQGNDMVNLKYFIALGVYFSAFFVDVSNSISIYPLRHRFINRESTRIVIEISLRPLRPGFSKARIEHFLGVICAMIRMGTFFTTPLERLGPFMSSIKFGPRLRFAALSALLIWSHPL